MSAKEVLKKYETEINKCDFDLLTPLLSRDGTFWFTSGTFTGLDQARKVCTYTFNWEGIIEPFSKAVKRYER